MTTIDVDQLVENVQPWEMRFTQLTQGKFNGRCEIVELDGLIFYREHWTQRVLAQGATPAGYLMLGYAPNTTWCGNPLSAECLAFASPGTEVSFVTSVNADHAVVLMPYEKVEHLLGDEFAGALPGDRLLHTGARFQQQFTNFLRRYVAHPGLLNNPYKAVAVESRLVQLLGDHFGGTAPYIRKSNGSKTWKLILQTLEILDESNRAMTVAELAGIACMSQRTLEHAFKKGLGISPLKFDRVRRLMGVYKTLCATERDADLTVAKVANQWGFSELGRFSGHYRSVFGEYPSETLKKPRTKSSPRLADMITQRPRIYAAATNF